MKKQIITGIFALCSIFAAAQDPGKITGNIKDGGQQAVIDAASVSLLKSSDSSLVKTALADKDGYFIFENVKPGSYLVLATSIGHEKTYSQMILMAEGQTEANTGMLQLQKQSKDLTAVVITTQKPLIERKIDRTIVNVQQYLSTAGGSAMEVLEKAPGVTIDKDGNISLKGKQGVLIMIDGKPTYMSGTDLVNFLTNLPSSSLDQLEIMTNPPAKYDAAGNAGIINIKTKKDKIKGFNGSVSSSVAQGIYFKTSNSLNLNYRNNKVNLFSNLSGNYRKEFQDLDIHREYLMPDKSLKSSFDQESREQRVREYYNFKIGADFYATPKTTMGIVLNSYLAPRGDFGLNTSNLYNESGALDSSVTTHRVEDGSNNHVGLNLNFRHKFDSSNREITADIDFLKYDSDVDQVLDNQGRSASGLPLSKYQIKGLLPSTVDIISARVDYTQQLTKKIKLDAGLKTSFVETNNQANYFLGQAGNLSPDYNRTNYFDYKENLNAAYVNFSTEIKKWGFQAGLRAENTSYDGLQHGNPTRTDSSFTNSYTSLFPTTYISFAPNDKNQLGFSYGRRISRPDYEDLNPFYHFIDPYTYDIGNPFLQPMFTNAFELSHTYKNKFTTTLSHSVTTDLFGESFNREGDAIVIRRYNYGKRINSSLSISGQVPVTKWWTAQVYTEGNYSHLLAEFQAMPVDIERTTFMANLNNQFKFKNGWSAELSGFFRTRGGEMQVTINPIMQMDAAVQKQILKKKGSLKLAVTDFTGPMKVSGSLEQINAAKASFSQQRDSRVLRLTFNYRFGKPMKTERRKTGGSASDEQNRLKSAN